jgi:hypothetical protein
LERLALIVRLKPGTEMQAEQLIATGPPFDPEESGFARHNVYLSASEVVFVFEAHEVEWLVDVLTDKPFQWMVEEAFDDWPARRRRAAHRAGEVLLGARPRSVSAANGRLGPCYSSAARAERDRSLAAAETTD